MTGKAEVERHRQQLDATIRRLPLTGAEPELLSDYSRYVSVLLSGFLEQALVAIALEYVRSRSAPQVLNHVESRVQSFTNAKSQKILEFFGSFDPAWRRDLEGFVVDEYKDAVDGIVEIRNRVSHGQYVGITPVRVLEYRARIDKVVDHVSALCLS